MWVVRQGQLVQNSWAINRWPRQVGNGDGCQMVKWCGVLVGGDGSKVIRGDGMILEVRCLSWGQVVGLDCKRRVRVVAVVANVLVPFVLA